MIGADNPGPFVRREFLGALTADLPQIPDPVIQQTRDRKVKRRNERNGEPT
jgi:hypothetical protein